MRISILILGFKGLKVYSKSFVSNKFNDFAGYSPVVHVHYMFCKKETRTLPKTPSVKTSQQKRLKKTGTTVQCIHLHHCFLH